MRDHRENSKIHTQIIQRVSKNIFCTPESFNTNISHQLFDYTITFVNSQQENTNSEGDYGHKTRF